MYATDKINDSDAKSAFVSSMQMSIKKWKNELISSSNRKKNLNGK